MSLHFYKLAILKSSTALADLLQEYKSYGEKIIYTEDDHERLNRSSENMIRLKKCLPLIKEGIQSLQSKIEKMEQQYANAKSRTEQKEMLQEIEDFENESKYSKILQDAEVFAHIVQVNIADAEVILYQTQMRLKIQVNSDTGVESQSTSGESSASNRELDRVPEQNTNCRSIRPPTVKLPLFSGKQEEFAEFWTLYESLVHNCADLPVVEKIMLLKQSLQGSAETAIRGIKPVPENYEWMVETLKKRFENQTTNRSKIVQRLFELPSAGKNADSCQHCFDTIRTLVHQMVSAGYDIRPTCDPMWTETIIKKFPYDIVKDVLIKNQNVDTVTIEQLLDILDKEIAAKAYVELRLGFEKTKLQPNTRQQNFAQNANCAFCGRSNHNSAFCRTVADPNKRRQIVRQNNLCWKCFLTDHTSNQCRKANCNHCGKTHHSSLCMASSNGVANPAGTNQPRTSRWPRNEVAHNNSANRNHSGPNTRHVPTSNGARQNHPQRNGGQRFIPNDERPTMNNQLVENGHIASPAIPQEQLILMTAEGNVYNHISQQYERVLFFFDTGAQKTVIEESLATKLGLPKITTETCVMSGIGGHTEKFESHSVKLNITTAFGADINMVVQTKPIITSGFPAIRLTKEDKEFLHIKELCIANSKVHGERIIPRILVGLDRYYDLVVADTTALRTPSGLHVAKTVFGPTLYGRGTIDSSTMNMSISHNYTSIEQPTEVAMLERMFELEGLGIPASELQKDETVQKYFEQYEKSISFENGLVTAPFPLKANIVDLADNYSVSIKRLSALQNQLRANTEQHAWYSKIIMDYESQGVIERVYNPEKDAVGTYYMPHSGVWRPHKKVPLRIVFDASSKMRGKLSLNDTIHKGESFINKIQSLLITCRTSRIIMFCDIEAAFTQIRLPKEHKDLCRFLWLQNVNLPATKGNVVEYRFTRLPFGITAAPSILNMCIAAYLNATDTDLAREIAAYIYVDNILLQADTPEEALRKYKDSKALFAKIGMNLREFISNSSIVNGQIPEPDTIPTGALKYLGTEYDTVTDRFTVTTRFPMKTTLTKRDIVSQLNSIYDPLGIAGPLLIELKSMMREILTTHSDWNDRLSRETCEKWNHQCSKVTDALIAVPRTLLGGLTYSQAATRLWVFADASIAAIAACAYMQSIQSNEVSPIIVGKTRLAPKKHVQTIPRLELLGILLAMRMATTVTEAVSCKIVELHIVTDSEVALCWVKSTKKLPVFVNNQCGRIRDLKMWFEARGVIVQYHHVPTSYNPADAGTRGLTKNHIQDHHWVRGPAWLRDYPNITYLRNIADIQAQDMPKEPEQPATVAAVQNVPTQEVQLFDLARISKLPIALRMVARVGKYLHRLVAKVNEKRDLPIQTQHIIKFDLDFEITAEDIKVAEVILHADIHKNVDVDELGKKFRNMHIIRDKFGVVRHISRLQHAPIPIDTKSPIFLPSRSEMTRLVLIDIHSHNAHCGKDQTLSLARQKYWIPRASGSFKYYLKNCAVCKRWNGLPFGSPQMPSLPTDRVMVTKPFSNVGCDYIGPFCAKNGDNMYIALYTCLVTRAVHLEVVENLSAGAFLNSFIRFVSRRGVPQLVRSDCGTNFRLGSKIIEELSKPCEHESQSVMSYSATNGIRWLFNPPASPWMGGVWERLVGSVKRCLRKSVGRKKLSFTEFSTAVTSIEAVLNTRPLTKLSSTDLSEIPLRPIDFLQGNLKFSLQDSAESQNAEDPSYEPQFIQTRRQAIEAISASEMIASKFWEKWRTEYLTTLRESQKQFLKQHRHISRTVPEKGEIVLIEHDLLPRGNWSYGKIVEVINSNDGLIRTAKVLTPNGGTLQRPINKLYPLEIRSQPEEDSRDAPIGDPINEIATRPVLPRSAKTRAYDAIRNFEESLEETQSQTSINVMQRSQVLPPARNSVANGPIKPAMLLTLMIAVLISPSSAHNATCREGIVEIRERNSSYELCFNTECKTFLGSNGMRTYKLPPSPTQRHTKIAMKYVEDDSTTNYVLMCLNPDFCAVSRSLLSTSLLGNPHCWPVGAVISVAIIFYLTSVMILISLWGMLSLIRITRKSPAQMQQMQNMNSINVHRENVQLHFLHPTPLSGGLVISLCIAVLAGTNAVDACQHGFTRYATNIICDQNNNCNLELSRELLFNRIQNEHCIEIRHQNKTVGLLKITLRAATLICSKESITYTRSTVHRVYSAVRCSQAGSCHGNVCDRISRNDTVPELSQARDFPGYIGCQYTCGGMSCGCLLPSPSCTFYKVAHVPVSGTVHEIVRCSEWTTSLHIEIESTLSQLSRKESIVLTPYITAKLREINITATSVQSSHLPVLNRRFALSSDTSAILPDDFRVPVECATRNEAMNNFKNCVNKIICDCNTGWTKHHCHCPDYSLRTVADDSSNRLPLLAPSIEIHSNGSALSALVKDIETVLTVHSNILLDSAEFVYEEKCDLRLSNIAGCYSCLPGAHVNVTCSSKDSTKITILCEEISFSVQCGPTKPSTMVLLHFDSALVQRNCHASCGDRKWVLPLNGTLFYHNSIHDSVFKFNEEDQKPISWLDMIYDIHLPDLEPLMMVIRNHWKAFLAAGVAALAAAGLTYLFGPIVILTVLKIAFGAIAYLLSALIKVAKALFQCAKQTCRNQ